MSIIKNQYYLYLLLLFFICVSPALTATTFNSFNIPPAQFSNQVQPGEPVLVWSVTTQNVSNFPNIAQGCQAVYTSAEQYGCIETGPNRIPNNESPTYSIRIATESQTLDGIRYFLGIEGGTLRLGVRNNFDGNQSNSNLAIPGNFNAPSSSGRSASFGPRTGGPCNTESECDVNAIAFLSGGTRLHLYVTPPLDILDRSRYEFNNVNLASLRVRLGTTNQGTIAEESVLFSVSGSIEIDKRCFVSVDQLTLSFPTIKSNMDNGVVGQTKLSTTSTCNNLGLRTSVSVKLVPVGSSITEGNAITLATSENGRRALGILFDPERFPTQCEGGDSQPFYNYLLLGNHEPGISSSTVQRDIYFSLCKYGIPAPGKHSAALDMSVRWEN